MLCQPGNQSIHRLIPIYPTTFRVNMLFKQKTFMLKNIATSVVAVFCFMDKWTFQHLFALAGIGGVFTSDSYIMFKLIVSKLNQKIMQ